MKWIIIFSVFFISLNAQQSKLDSVIIKLKNDSISYKQFVEMGRINCLKNKSINLEEEYASKYNLRFPFPRLISLSSLKLEYENYQRKNKTKKNCRCLYGDKESLKKMYSTLVMNIKNYNKEPEYDIESYMKDYLKNYYIQVDTK